MHKEKTPSIHSLHMENEMWINELKFHLDEIDIFERRLMEVIIKNTDKDALAKMESYQNKFIRQRELTEETLKELRGREKQILKFINDHPVATEHIPFTAYGSQLEAIERHRSLYAEMKSEFYHFISDWM